MRGRISRLLTRWVRAATEEIERENYRREAQETRESVGLEGWRPAEKRDRSLGGWHQ